jgi:hypothetical protein
LRHGVAPCPCNHDQGHGGDTDHDPAKAFIAAKNRFDGAAILQKNAFIAAAPLIWICNTAS